MITTTQKTETGSAPVASQPAKPKRTRTYGFTPWARRRIDKEQVRLLEDELRGQP